MSKKASPQGPIARNMLMRTLLYWGLYHVILWQATFLFGYLQYRGKLLSGGSPMTMSELYGQFVMEYFPMILCALFILPILLWDAQRAARQVVGPLDRLRLAMRKLARGEHVDPIELRKSDLLADFANSFNELAEATQNKWNGQALGGRSPAARVGNGHNEKGQVANNLRPGDETVEVGVPCEAIPAEPAGGSRIKTRW